MATLRELNIKLGLNSEAFEKGLKRSSAALRKEGRNWSELGNQLSAAVTLPIAAAAAGAIKAAASYESMEASFSVMLGSAEKAKSLFADLKKDAAATPFELTELSDATKRLLAFGISSNDVRSNLKMLGDIAAGSGSNIGELARIFGQAKAVGTVLTADLRELANRGIPIFDVLMKKFNMTGEELRKFVEGGNVKFRDLQEALASMTKEGGLFFGGMAKQSQTLSGQFSTFKDNVTASLAALGQSISDAFDLKGKMQAASTWLGEVAAAFESLDGETKKTIVTTGLLVAAIGPAVKVYGMFKTTVAGALDILRGTIGVFKSVSGGVLSMAESFQKFNQVQKATIAGLGLMIGIAIVEIYSQWQEAANDFAQSQKFVADAVSAANIEIAKEQIESNLLFDTLKNVSKGTDKRKEALERLQAKFPGYLDSLDVERSSLTDIATAQQLVNNEIIRNAALKAKANAQSEIANEIAKKMTRITELQNGAQYTIGEAARVNTFEMIKFGGTAGAIMQKLRKDVELLNQQLTNIDQTFDKTFGIAASGQSVVDTNALGNYYADKDGDKPKSSSGGKIASTGGSKAAKKLQDEVKNTATVLGDLEKAYTKINTKQNLFGDSFDANAERVSAVKNAINELIEQGITPADPAMQMLIERYAGLTTGVTTLATEMNEVLLPATLATTTAMTTQAETLSRAWMVFAETVGAASLAAGEAMQDLAAKGETSYKALGKAALRAATDVIRASIMKAVAGQIEKLLATVPPPFNLAIAAAGGAAVGVLFNKALKAIKVPAMAEGGLVTKPTLALIGEKGPEMVVPPKKFPGVAAMMGIANQNTSGEIRLSGEFRVVGSDLVLALDRATQDRIRKRGY